MFLRVLLAAFKPVNNLICCKTGLMWVVKRATSLFNWFCSNDGRKFAFFLLPVLPDLGDRNCELKTKTRKRTKRCDVMVIFTTTTSRLLQSQIFLCFFVVCVCVCKIGTVKFTRITKFE